MQADGTADYAERAGDLLGERPRQLTVVGGEHGYRHITATLADGRGAFIKATADRAAPPASTVLPASAAGPTQAHLSKSASERDAAAFRAEANGLRWLAEANAVPIPQVLAVGTDMLIIELLPNGSPSARDAYDFGQRLAKMHAASAESYGAPWRGFIASLPLDNTDLADPADPAHPADPANPADPAHPSDPAQPAGAAWAHWYAERRLAPYLRLAADARTLSGADVRLFETVLDRIEEFAGPPEPPSRIHGDCWSGNVMWPGGTGHLIDPAAHGGHRETDLAMLALFGAPRLDRILAGYNDAAPLAEGWRARVPLHQLHPLLVHVCLFGATYTAQARAAAHTLLSH